MCPVPFVCRTLSKHLSFRTERREKNGMCEYGHMLAVTLYWMDGHFFLKYILLLPNELWVSEWFNTSVVKSVRES